MKIVEGVNEVAAFVVEVLLSCGPSQIYGVVKGAIDLYKYAQIRSKIYKWEDIKNVNKSYNDKIATKSFKKIQKINPKADGSHLFAKAFRRLFELEQEREQRLVSLKKDLVSLIPLVGALFAWRIGVPEEEKSLWRHTPFFTYAIAHAAQDLGKMIARWSLFYHDGHKNNIERIKARGITIPVGEGERTLDALWYPGLKTDPTGPTVVVTHGNAMICHEMENEAEWYQARGFNVLLVTMGGYDGSPGIRTSEQSCYQDVEAIKRWLEYRKGVKHVGYHGFSIGSALAFQGAVGETEANVKTMFVVAEKAFTSVRGVFANIVSNYASSLFTPIAEGIAITVTPPGVKVRLSHTLTVETDGFNNEAKAKKMIAAKIPLFAIQSLGDEFMGSKWNGHIYEENFAGNLLIARYGSLEEKNLMVVQGTHGISSMEQKAPREQRQNLEDFIKKAKLKAIRIT